MINSLKSQLKIFGFILGAGVLFTAVHAHAAGKNAAPNSEEQQLKELEMALRKEGAIIFAQLDRDEVKYRRQAALDGRLPRRLPEKKQTSQSKAVTNLRPLTPVETAELEKEIAEDLQGIEQEKGEITEQISHSENGKEVVSERHFNGDITDQGIASSPQIQSLIPLRENPNPDYPEEDRLNRQEGYVTLLATVNSSGQVTKIKVEKNGGTLAMKDASIRAFAKHRFQAGTAGVFRQTFNFKLSSQVEEAPSRLRRF